MLNDWKPTAPSLIFLPSDTCNLLRKQIISNSLGIIESRILVKLHLSDIFYYFVVKSYTIDMYCRFNIVFPAPVPVNAAKFLQYIYTQSIKIERVDPTVFSQR